MQAQIKAWGNSQGIRIPKEVLQEEERLEKKTELLV